MNEEQKTGEQNNLRTDLETDSSPRKNTRESEEFYSALFQNNHAVMLLVDPETADIVDANPAACSFYQYSYEQFNKDEDTRPQYALERLVSLKPCNRSRLEHKNYFHFQHRLVNGEIRDVEVYSGPVRIEGRTLLYSIIHDITERKRAEERLEESERSLKAILSASPIGICRLEKQDFRMGQ